MAQAYDFQYELVQYKWPRWLHQQTEKQRLIWGYKILFLDVLFPLAVDKIIFVDADQVSLNRANGIDVCVTSLSSHHSTLSAFIFWRLHQSYRLDITSLHIYVITGVAVWQYLALRSAPYLDWVLR